MSVCMYTCMNACMYVRMYVLTTICLPCSLMFVCVAPDCNLFERSVFDIKAQFHTAVTLFFSGEC